MFEKIKSSDVDVRKDSEGLVFHYKVTDRRQMELFAGKATLRKFTDFKIWHESHGENSLDIFLRFLGKESVCFGEVVNILEKLVS